MIRYFDKHEEQPEESVVMCCISSANITLFNEVLVTTINRSTIVFLDRR